MSIANSTTISPGPCEGHSCVVPELALCWFLENACTSNRDLAVISSINRRIRAVTLSFIQDMVEEAVLPLRQQSVSHISPGGCSNERLKSSEPLSRNYIEFSKLLLPDMALEILKRRLQHYQINKEYTTPTFEGKHSIASSPLLDQESKAFCLSWFHPRGISIRTLDIAQNEEDDDSSSDDGQKWESPGDIDLSTYITESATRNSKANKQLDNNSSSSESFKAVTDEWRSYQNATDVLFPFDYATCFVRDVLALASGRNLTLFLRDEDSREFENSTWDQLSKPRRSNFAVRGATWARPHGFCLCWADEEDKDTCFPVEIRDASSTELKRNLNMRNANHRHFYYRLKAKHRRDKRRRIRMRYSLPRIALSTMAKNPDYQALPNQSLVGKLEGRRQRCIQFLNADKTRAVYMRTPPFDCGPVLGPITMFLVAIATEDGCFVSGLTSRFELGHNYGTDSDDMVEMSPISMATDVCAYSFNPGAGTTLNRSGTSSRRSSFRSSVVDDSDDSSIENDDLDEIGDLNCRCKIQCQKRFEANEDSYEDEESTFYPKVDQECIIRGTMGPGRWHLYTATFDGNKSILRVDGVDEPVNLPEMTSSSRKSAPVLDGLTIGSDHMFDMSLCFGEGSDGEGEGCVSELCCFKGTMDKYDIECFERYLMKKHGIIHGSTGFRHTKSANAKVDQEIKEKDGDQWQEDQWMRDVHSLMAHPPPFAASDRRIPLRFAARHRTVAWQRSCEVTGKPIRVSRIGSRLSTGSSDW